ncbi:monovalent cation/H(+) antiporter subunit G [Halorarum salinum]|uniref:Monovalent cation/H(+) antiporter subunit G n=1 Tax=Halorarum salinum TaxID=2743089 RepID=A0A7D5LBW7_9EURY|nr:monovalent cation/H(+) antiporter subunit G [Halobaculum salinum]QLG62910.1 monovalent cation/H(+) antiporter subunit G [Halobaculum salinum]
MVTLREAAVMALLGGGLFFALVAAVGLVRLPDLYTRAHSASKSDTLGAVLTLGAAGIALGPEPGTLKVGLLLVFMFITNPTAAHAIARAAADQGIEPWTDEDASAEEGTPAVDEGPPAADEGGERA